VMLLAAWLEVHVLVAVVDDLESLFPSTAKAVGMRRSNPKNHVLPLLCIQMLAAE
jgi:chorismate mutase